jgi:hypothetical protein
MSAVKRFKKALQEHEVEDIIIAEIMKDYENISDKSKKFEKAAFFKTAVSKMDELLDSETSKNIRDSCACSKGGWRLKAMKKIVKEYNDKSLDKKIEAINNVTHMGKPVLNMDGSITASIGEKGGFECPCPVFHARAHEIINILNCASVTTKLTSEKARTQVWTNN